jgi:uncharacterized coiled-coil protein SlyX
MSKEKMVCMASTLNVVMTELNDIFQEKWKNSKREQKRVTLMEEALEFVNEQAYKDFGMGQSSFSMEVSKLILIAKECLEKENSE